MRVNKINKGLVFTATAVVALLVISVCPLLSVACATGASTHLNPPPQPAVTSDVVLEWNDLAVRLTLQAAPALAAVQQTRVMAIFQVAVHDAVNGITGDYETYLTPPAPPQNASPEAAAIGAAHEALRNLFQGNDALLDSRLQTSLQEHGSSVNDPSVLYGRAVAASILAVRANDH